MNACEKTTERNLYMKLTKTLLTIIGAVAVMNIAAFAGDLTPVQIPNGHGQVTVLYRSSEPTIALYTGRGVGASSASSGELRTVSKDNGHGQSVIMNRQN